MAVKAIAYVTDIIQDDTTSTLNIYLTMSANGQHADDTAIGIAVSSVTIWPDVVAFVKAYCTTNFGATFDVLDTVELYHPTRVNLS